MSTFILALILWAMEITGVGDVLDPVIRPVPVFTPVPGDGNQVIDDIQIYGPESSVFDPEISIFGIGPDGFWKYTSPVRVLIVPGPDGEMVIEIQSNNPIEIDQSTDGKCATITAR